MDTIYKFNEAIIPSAAFVGGHLLITREGEGIITDGVVLTPKMKARASVRIGPVRDDPQTQVMLMSSRSMRVLASYLVKAADHMDAGITVPTEPQPDDDYPKPGPITGMGPGKKDGTSDLDLPQPEDDVLVEDIIVPLGDPWGSGPGKISSDLDSAEPEPVIPGRVLGLCDNTLHRNGYGRRYLHPQRKECHNWQGEGDGID